MITGTLVQQGLTHPAAEAALPHDTRVPAVTGTASLGPEHVVVVAFVVAVSEALGTQGHALRDPAGLTSEGDKVGSPDQAAHHGVVVLLHVVAEVIRGPSSAHKPPAPVNSLAVVQVLLRVEEVVHQGLEVCGGLQDLWTVPGGRGSCLG